MDSSTHEARQDRDVVFVVGQLSAFSIAQLRDRLGLETIDVDAAHEASIIVACNATTGDLDRLRNFYSVPIIVMVPVKATSELARLDLYEHGADTIIESGQTELFIAHIRALLRRRDWRTDHRTTENPLRSVDPQETGG